MITAYTSGKYKIPFYVDDVDAWVLDYNWGALYSKGKLKCIRRGERKSGIYSHHFLHRDIANPDKDMQVDHIDKNPANNCRNNLRICTNAENSRNRSGHNTLKKKGVYKSKYGKYISLITINGIRKYLGIYEKAEDAHIAYCEAAKKYHGEFASFD